MGIGKPKTPRSNAPSPEQQKPGSPTSQKGLPSPNGSTGSSWETYSSDSQRDDPDVPDGPGQPEAVVVPSNEADQQFTLFSNLPPELRRMIWANAAGYEANEPRIIHLQIVRDPVLRPHPYYRIDAFRIESPASQYQAPNCQAIADQESLNLYNIRFPNQLRFGRAAVRVGAKNMQFLDFTGETIDFNPNRDIIYLDIESLVRLAFMFTQGRSLVGFDQIRHLATTLDDNNIRLIQNFLRNSNGTLRNVTDIIQVCDSRSDVRNTDSWVEFLSTAMGRDLSFEEEIELVDEYFGPVLSQEELESDYSQYVKPTRRDVVLQVPGYDNLMLGELDDIEAALAENRAEAAAEAAVNAPDDSPDVQVGAADDAPDDAPDDTGDDAQQYESYESALRSYNWSVH